jgi:hypothetical protein
MKIDLRTILLLLLVLVSTYLILSPYVLKRQGVLVSYVENSDCTLKPGDVINSIRGQQINSLEDFNKVIKNIKKGEHVTMVVNNGPGSCTAIEDGYLGINVTKLPSDELRFGIDLQGGVITILKPEKNVNNVAEILKKRAVAYMMPDVQVLVNGSTIKLVSLSPDVVPVLLEKGVFEATILENVEITNNTGDIPVGDNVYTVELVDKDVKVNGVTYSINSTFQLDNITFKVKNVTNVSVVVEASVFGNADVLRTLGSGTLSYNSNTKMYEFSIPIEISEEASKRFNKILKNAPTYFNGRQTLVEGFLVYYIDGKPISSLLIPAEFARQEVRQLSVIGFSPNINDASLTRQKVFASLESGELVTDVKVIGFDSYKPSLQNVSLLLTGISFGSFLAILSTVFYFRYKKLKVGFVAIALTLTCVFVTLGFLALVQKILPMWVINFQTLLGLIVLMFVCMYYSFISAEVQLKKSAHIITIFRKNISLKTVSDFLIIVVAFALLFTSFKFFATTLLAGFIIYRILVSPLYEKRL